MVQRDSSDLAMKICSESDVLMRQLGSICEEVKKKTFDT